MPREYDSTPIVGLGPPVPTPIPGMEWEWHLGVTEVTQTPCAYSHSQFGMGVAHPFGEKALLRRVPPFPFGYGSGTWGCFG